MLCNFNLFLDYIKNYFNSILSCTACQGLIDDNFDDSLSDDFNDINELDDININSDNIKNRNRLEVIENYL